VDVNNSNSSSGTYDDDIAPTGGRRLQADTLIPACPPCKAGQDVNLAPPPSSGDRAVKAHLLAELRKHDLSWCFCEPVDVTVYTDYLGVVGREEMMDLKTMEEKLMCGKYDGRTRGCGLFLADFKRMWRNCRRYASCDEHGKPKNGVTLSAGGRGNQDRYITPWTDLQSARTPDVEVPGIVRCAFVLERLVKDFSHEHMHVEMPASGLAPGTYDPTSSCSQQWSLLDNACAAKVEQLRQLRPRSSSSGSGSISMALLGQHVQPSE